MTREPRNDEQAAAQRSVERAFPAVAAFLAEDRVARPDADLMRVDAPQASGPRTITVRLLDAPGATMTVTCPDWCASGHRRDVEGVFAADLTHYGAPVDLPVHDDRGVPVLRVRLMQTPFSSGERQPVAVLDEPEEEMTPHRLCAFADQLRAYADALDDVAFDLDGARTQCEQGRRADHEGRWTR
ncbi:DUF6907 domain-containing protein [Streptomyces scabiei]|uniref:DUF6907 domain-containing protein n=1 Tax=Streptomyces scabiei TaxID=1930 RepID=UPI0029B1EB7E|nr:hypothetical protein [Streptomyces scabiei]MDX3519286.1 hypothetical protein [Streptomyces scabiei]